MVTISKTRSTPQDQSNIAFRDDVATKAERYFGGRPNPGEGSEVTSGSMQ
jgi:hypothetical protein